MSWHVCMYHLASICTVILHLLLGGASMLAAIALRLCLPHKRVAIVSRQRLALM